MSSYHNKKKYKKKKAKERLGKARAKRRGDAEKAKNREEKAIERILDERKNGDFIRELIEQGYVNTCHDLSDGGLLVAATEMALSGNIGLTLEGPKDPGFWFGEDQARYLLAVPKSKMVMIMQKAQDRNILVQNIGHTGGNALTLNGSPPICLKELRRLHESWLPNYMENA